MKVILFGATGMVGQGVLRECLLDADVTEVVTLGRTATGVAHPKLREIVHRDLFDYTTLESDLTGFDACFFCLGVSSFRMSEAEYTRLTYDMTMAAGQTLARLNPQMTFVYVTGAGCDSTEQGSSMWARVKGRTENALQRLPFKAAFMFRPGAIVPMHGVRSKTALYQTIYSLTRPVLPLLQRMFPNAIVTTEQVGRAMLAVAKRGAPSPILESRDIARY
ncbi:epimerase [Caballeronia humi]|uniref:Nucleoside-diphosphate-sugar epimerase-like protein n=1 Tax=Caballeronia humi TaxID=326474 RepID=A0A158FTK6_9BURK|nr:epimerase [Caballeronia humi]SAL23132.1 nucleoside-diphosphate-sugar epimerase-like protein [Caballeronia humi]